MRVFAHRGDIRLGPENSLLAIQQAFTQGFDVELDVRLHSQGDFILSHDNNLKRLFGVDKLVNEVDPSTVQQYMYLSNPKAHLTTFAEVANILPHYSNRMIAIHLKREDQNSHSLQLLHEYFQRYHLYNQAFVFDLTVECAVQLRSIDPKVPIAFIVSDNNFEPTVYTWDQIVPNLHLCDAIWAAEWRELYSQSFFDRIHQYHKLAWAVSPELHYSLGHPKAQTEYASTWPDFNKWGVDGICTDYPDRLMHTAHL